MNPQPEPPLTQLTLYDITGQPEVPDEDPPLCPICHERLYDTNLNPVEITFCHHRFHRNCLQQNCNGPQSNTLQNCRCPVCRGVFDFNTQIIDLNPYINNRLQQLQQPQPFSPSLLRPLPRNAWDLPSQNSSRNINSNQNYLKF